MYCTFSAVKEKTPKDEISEEDPRLIKDMLVSFQGS